METTYLRHHCVSQALFGLIQSLSRTAVSQTIDAPLRQMAAEIYEHGKPVWDNFLAERMRSNLGTRSHAENITQQDGLFGNPTLLFEHPGISDQNVIKSGLGPASNVISPQTVEWPKMIFKGQQFNAHSYSRTGHACYAIVTLQGLERVARICHITQTRREDVKPTVVLICQLFQPLHDLVIDQWARLRFGFLVQDQTEPGHYHIFQNALLSAVVLTPTVIDGHNLLIAARHSMVRPCNSLTMLLFS